MELLIYHWLKVARQLLNQLQVPAIARQNRWSAVELLLAVFGHQILNSRTLLTEGEVSALRVALSVLEEICDSLCLQELRWALRDWS